MGIKRTLAVLLAAAMLMALPAWAEESEIQVAKNENGSYRVTCPGEAGERYSLMVLRAGADPARPAEGDLLYAAQTTADVAGLAAFENVRLKVNRTADVYVSGGRVPVRRALPQGILVEGYTISGKVSLEGRDNAEVATVYLLTDATNIKQRLQTIEVGSTGEFTFDAQPAGEYFVIVDGLGIGFLTEAIPVTLTDSDVNMEPMMMLGGDISGDQWITPYDLGLLLVEFGRGGDGAPISNRKADINGDGTVDQKDLDILLKNLMKRGVYA